MIFPVPYFISPWLIYLKLEVCTYSLINFKTTSHGNVELKDSKCYLYNNFTQKLRVNRSLIDEEDNLINAY